MRGIEEGGRKVMALPCGCRVDVENIQEIEAEEWRFTGEVRKKTVACVKCRCGRIWLGVENSMPGRGDETPRRLPVFDGYTVDERLREFRKAESSLFRSRARMEEGFWRG